MRLGAYCAICFACVALGPALPAAGEIQFREGHWRLELHGGWGIHQGGRDCSGETKVYVVAEYEFPATQRLTLGLRLTPFLFHDGPKENVVGVGVGLATRLYAKKESYTGLFGELKLDVLGHHRHFEQNSSNLNFQTGIGIGYQFDKRWHMVIDYEHISNASIASRNKGTNTVGLGLGYRF